MFHKEDIQYTIACVDDYDEVAKKRAKELLEVDYGEVWHTRVIKYINSVERIVVVFVLWDGHEVIIDLSYNQLCMTDEEFKEFKIALDKEK